MPGRDARPKGINLASVPATSIAASTSIYPHVRPPCEGTIYSEDPSGPGGDVYCPLRQFYANESVPWVYPQPPVHTCPTCVLNVTNLYLGISNEAPTTMSEPRLTVVDNHDNTKVYELELGSGLKPGATFKVTGLGFTSSDLKAISKASFDVQVGTKTVDSSPILVEP